MSENGKKEDKFLFEIKSLNAWKEEKMVKEIKIQIYDKIAIDVGIVNTFRSIEWILFILLQDSCTSDFVWWDLKF